MLIPSNVFICWLKIYLFLINWCSYVLQFKLPMVWMHKCGPHFTLHHLINLFLIIYNKLNLFIWKFVLMEQCVPLDEIANFQVRKTRFSKSFILLAGAFVVYYQICSNRTICSIVTILPTFSTFSLFHLINSFSIRSNKLFFSIVLMEQCVPLE